MLRTFSIQTLGCRVNQYESEQIATLLRGRGLRQTGRLDDADLRVINTCSVTVQAASKSRQLSRRAARLQVLQPTSGTATSIAVSDLVPASHDAARARPRIVVTGCWATSDKSVAQQIPGVDAVLGHHDCVAEELLRLLDTWLADEPSRPSPASRLRDADSDVADSREPRTPDAFGDEGWMNEGERVDASVTPINKPRAARTVKEIPMTPYYSDARRDADVGGTTSLPILDARQTTHQRAYLKIQDGCDAHCTYCIIPKLRPIPWSKPVEDVITEARRLVEAGHRELVLTGIFLGAYAQPTALRRRQPHATGKPLARLAKLLCQQVPELRRLRFSSLEPGDLDAHLVDAFKDLPALVPHFHLPLQSGSDALLRRMNRQYTRDDFCRMIDRVQKAFDRPALTTDIIVGFPGETDDEFARTLEVVDEARFIHIHAFHFSPRPGTAAARWTRDFVHGPIVNDRIAHLRERAQTHDLAFRRQFLGQSVELLIERDDSAADAPPRPRGEAAPLLRVRAAGVLEERCAPEDTVTGHKIAASPEGSGETPAQHPIRHGRCERYFGVHFSCPPTLQTGALVRVRVDSVTRDGTFGTVVQ